MTFVTLPNTESPDPAVEEKQPRSIIQVAIRADVARALRVRAAEQGRRLYQTTEEVLIRGLGLDGGAA